MLMVLLSMLRDEPILIFASSSHIIAIFVLHFGFVVGGAHLSWIKKLKSTK